VNADIALNASCKANIIHVRKQSHRWVANDSPYSAVGGVAEGSIANEIDDVERDKTTNRFLIPEVPWPYIPQSGRRMTQSIK
jgi:hypothetical protein